MFAWLPEKRRDKRVGDHASGLHAGLRNLGTPFLVKMSPSALRGRADPPVLRLELCTQGGSARLGNVNEVELLCSAPLRGGRSPRSAGSSVVNVPWDSAPREALCASAELSSACIGTRASPPPPACTGIEVCAELLAATHVFGKRIKGK